MRFLLWGALALVVLTVVAAIFFRMAGSDPAAWHVDPTTADRTGKPNDYLAAPAGVTEATADIETEPREIPTEELMFLFDAIARNAPRTDVLAGSVEGMHVTYVQRSLAFGFPDYITVKAVDLGEGRSGLVIWSRSRYGYSDMGVNAARVTNWLAKIGA